MKAPEAKVAKMRKDAVACEQPIAFVTIDLLASVVSTFPKAPTHLDVETPLALGRLATSSGSNRLQARTVSLRSSLAYYVDHHDTPRSRGDDLVATRVDAQKIAQCTVTKTMLCGASHVARFQHHLHPRAHVPALQPPGELVEALRPQGLRGTCPLRRLRSMGPGSTSAFTRVFDALWAGMTLNLLPRWGKPALTARTRKSSWRSSPNPSSRAC
jgi:hypothetical protein